MNIKRLPQMRSQIAFGQSFFFVIDGNDRPNPYVQAFNFYILALRNAAAFLMSLSGSSPHSRSMVRNPS